MNKKPDYSYQDALVDRAYHELMLGNPTLLAACPGAGKTRMAIRIADRFKRKSPKSKILILTHGQTLLREQWGDVLEKHSSYNMAIVTPGIADFEIARADILVAIPQTLQFIKIDNWSIDLLIVDEAHHWYLSDAVQKGIVEVLKPNHTLLLTGSPSPYVGDPKWSIMGITVQELLEYGVLTDPVIELVESAYHFTMRDYRHNMNLKPDTAMGTDETDKTLDSILQSMIKKLVSADRISPEDYAWDNSWPRTLNKLSKTMFVCHTQSQAKDVAAYFDQRGVSYSLSISFENDGMDALTKFKTDKDCNVFIVVNRGTIGFDFDKLYNVVDMSATLNVNRLFQMLCRVVRRDMDNPDGKKLFIKVTSPEVKELTHFVMSFVVALSDPEYYFSYKTKNAKKTLVPVPAGFIESIEDQEEDEEGPTRGKRRPSLPKLNTFTDIKNMRKGEMNSFAYTDFNTVRRRIETPGRNIWNESTAMVAAKKCTSRKELEKRYPGAYSWFWRNKKNATLTKLYGEKVKQAWTMERVKDAISKSKNRVEFRKHYLGAYNWLYRNDHKKLYLALPKATKTVRFTVKGVLSIAEGFESQNAFRAMHYGAYSFMRRAKKLHLLKQLFANRTGWNIEKALRAAEKCKTKEHFRTSYPAAFNYLKTINFEFMLDRVYLT